jgi:hypothetical protein
MIPDLIRRFEAGTWPAAEFTHDAHVTVAAWYITGGDDALAQLRTRIPVYNVLQGGQNTTTAGYHETLTTFWFHILSDFLEALPPETPRSEAIDAAVAEFGRRPGLFRDYFDYDVLKSPDARRVWMPPALPPDTLRRWLARERSTVRA